MKSLTILFFLFLFSREIFSQWIQQTSGTVENLNSVFFTDASTGYTVGTSIRKTTNSGTNWTLQFTPPSVFLNSVYFFPSSGTGWTVGSAGSIYKTTNGGTNWTLITAPTMSYNSVYFNSTTGWAVGNAGLIRSTDFGNTWTMYSTGTGANLYGVNASSNVDVLVCGSGGVIIKSTNGGLNWTTQTSNIPADLYSIYFGSFNTAWATGNNGGVTKTTNVGTSWTAQPSGSTAVLYGCFFFSDMRGWSVGSGGAIIVTTNGGTNWLTENSGITTDLKSVYFVDANTGWAVGAGGKILYTQNGGSIGIHQISSEVPSQFSLSQNYPNPFNPSSKFKIQISKLSYVKVIVFDALGREVQTLVNEQLTPGTYEIDFKGNKLSSGVYYYKLITGEFVDTKKMILVK